jgi:hypothetical protein
MNSTLAIGGLAKRCSVFVAPEDVATSFSRKILPHRAALGCPHDCWISREEELVYEAPAEPHRWLSNANRHSVFG